MVKVAGVALAAVMVCGLAGETQAYEFVYKGVITDVTDYSGGLPSGSFVVGASATITISGRAGPYSSMRDGVTYLDPTRLYYTISTGSVVSGVNSDYPERPYIMNDGNTSSEYIAVSAAGFGSLYGYDADGGINIASNKPNIPLDPEQSFGPIAVTGTAGFSEVLAQGYDPETGLYAASGRYYVSVDIQTLQGIGDISAVPLPSSAPMFGAALLGLAGLGYAAKHKRAA